MARNRRTRPPKNKKIKRKKLAQLRRPARGSYIERVLDRDGRVVGVAVGYWCNDPNCSEKH